MALWVPPQEGSCEPDYLRGVDSHQNLVWLEHQNPSTFGIVKPATAVNIMGVTW